jgi:hypothetical protein
VTEAASPPRARLGRLLAGVAFVAMSEADDYVRAAKGRRRRAPAAPEVEAEPAKKSPGLVSQGGRSAPPGSAPPSIDAAIRRARRRSIWTPIG